MEWIVGGIVFGLVLYMSSHRGQRPLRSVPNTAKAAGAGALIGLIFWVISQIIVKLP